jgi:hypothetical protein
MASRLRRPSKALGFKMSRALLLITILILPPACLAQNLSGQEFRIESQVYAGQSTQPISHNVTLFTPKLICDMQMSDEAEPQPVEYVVFDPRQQLFVLLDVQREVRMEIFNLELMRLMEGLRRETMQNDRTKFLTDDTFEEDTDWSDGWVTLTSSNITYQFKGSQPDDVSCLPLYFDFLDHFTRLKASDPTQIPPFSRIRLNQTIKKLGWIPSEVKIDIRQNGLFREPFQATSKHVLTNGLSTSDQEMIEQAKKLWMQYKAVPLTEYRGIGKKSILAAIKKNKSPQE